MCPKAQRLDIYLFDHSVSHLLESDSMLEAEDKQARQGPMIKDFFFFFNKEEGEGMVKGRGRGRGGKG